VQKPGRAGWYRPLGNPQSQNFQGFRTTPLLCGSLPGLLPLVRIQGDQLSQLTY
jgi:hypothetical protein